MNLKEIKEKINLRIYARDYHGLSCNSRGLATCPFHGPDKHPSFAINFDDGIWKWYDPHDQTGGSIVDFECKFRNCSEKQAIENLLKIFKGKDPPPGPMGPVKTINTKSHNYGLPTKETIPYVYKNQDGEEVLKKEKKIFIDGERTFFWCHKEGSQWKKGMGGHEHIPFNLDQFKNHERIIVAEGESDSVTINDLKIGEFATTAPTGAGDWQPSLTKYFANKELVFLYDVGAEEDVRNHASELKRTYPEMKISIATVPLKEKNTDITDYLNQFKTIKEKQIAFVDVLSKDKEFKKENILPPAKLPIPVSVCLANISPESIDWLWFNKFPLKKICMLVGDPGVGKSFFVLFMASKITTGKPWPDIGGPIEQGSVIYITSDDTAADTIRPRADAMGADVKKIYVFSELITRKNNKLEFFNIEYHMPGLSYLIEEIGDVRLVAIDDINSFSGNIDTSNIAAVKWAMNPASRIAEKENLTILFTSHLNKDKAQKALYRTTGSMGYMATPRAVWGISRDPDEPSSNRRFFTHLKSNLSINPKNLAFNFIGSDITDSIIEFESSPLDLTSDEIFGPLEEQEPGAFAFTEEWLIQLFKDENDIPAKEVLFQAKENGITDRTLRRVKKKLSIRSIKAGIWKDRQWVWRKE